MTTRMQDAAFRDSHVATPGTGLPASGILWAYQFRDDGSAQLIPSEDVERTLSEHGNGWTWVHLGLSDNRCRAWIAHHAPVTEPARELLAGADQHLRLDILGREIMGVLPDLRQEIGQRGDEIVRLRFVMTERMLITSRQRPVHSIENTRRAVEAGKRFPTAITFLDAVIDEFADAVALMTERLGDELDRSEDHLLHDEPSDERTVIGRARLQAVRVHRQLAQLRSIFLRLEPRIAADNAPAAQALRALTQKLDGIDHEVDSIVERARLLLDEVEGRMTAITNRRLFTLSVLTACFLPPTLVTGFFGMNTKDLPFQDMPGGTWLAAGVALAACGLTYWALRRVRAF